MNDVHRLQGVDGDATPETSIAYILPSLWGDLVWGDIRDLQGPTKATLPSEDLRGGSQVPEDEGGRRGMPKCW
jgi:hypothetical protein